MTITRLFAAIGVVVLLCGIVAGLLPTRTTVEADVLPDVPLIDLGLEVGGWAGVSITPDGQTFEVDCGSTFVRNRFAVENTNVVQSTLGVAGRVEGAIESSCDSALESRAAISVGSIAVGTLLLMLSLALATLKAAGRLARGTWRALTGTSGPAGVSGGPPAADPFAGKGPTVPASATPAARRSTFDR